MVLSDHQIVGSDPPHPEHALVVWTDPDWIRGAIDRLDDSVPAGEPLSPEQTRWLTMLLDRLAELTRQSAPNRSRRL